MNACQCPTTGIMGRYEISDFKLSLFRPEQEAMTTHDVSLEKALAILSGRAGVLGRSCLTYSECREDLASWIFGW